MSDENAAPETTEQPQYTAEQVQAMAAELERLKSHQSKLLEETKTAKQKAAELEEAQRIAEEEALKKSGEFQKLYESESEKAARISREFEEFQGTVRDREKQRQLKDISADAIKLMAAHAADEASVELLSEKAQQYAVYTEDGIQYEIGGVRVDRAKLVETLATKYPRLFKGDGAMGGGALGGKGGSASTSGNTKADEAKKKGDVNGFLAAHLT